ncbi:hypothetical protein M569_05234, partial [Genlisea aurea]
RILMLPWLAYGHTSPFVELAKALARRGFIIYICSSPANLHSVRDSVSTASVEFIELHLPESRELPPRYHTTNGLPPHLMADLKEALIRARPGFAEILRSLNPDLVIYDFIQPWAAEEASSLGIPAVFFNIFGEASSSLFGHRLWRSESEYPFPAIHYRGHELGFFNRIVDGFELLRGSVGRSSEIILVRTFRELEGKYIDYHSELTKKRHVPVGHLVRDPEEAYDEEEEKKAECDAIMKWLDERTEKSTVFASFGTEYFLSDEEMEGIAGGLETSEANFIWVLTSHMGDDDDAPERLPDGFLRRTRSRGLVLAKWAPQLRILSHRSVGGFLSHCGRSSVIEGLYCGVPIVALPMHLDQPLNARLLTEAGLAEEASRTEEGKIDGMEVARAVKKAVSEESGEGLRRRVAEMSRVMKGKGEEEIGGAVEELL